MHLDPGSPQIPNEINQEIHMETCYNEKIQEYKDEERILKAGRKAIVLTKESTNVFLRLPMDFSAETLQARRRGGRYAEGQPRGLYWAKLPCRREGETGFQTSKT